MKIAIITDIHHGPLSHTKKEGWDALAVVDSFVAWATEQGADLLLDLGDHISDTSADADAEAMIAVASRLARFEGPRVHILGNHDVANLSVAVNEAIFGGSLASRVVDLGEFRLIVWQPDVRLVPPGFQPTGAEHLAWLVAALEQDERPAIIATHVPLSGHSQIGNYYFELNPGYSTYPDHDAVRAAVEATGRAAAWLSGHVHWNPITPIRGIQHITVQSLSERFTTMPEPASAWSMLEIADGQLSVTVHGQDPFHVRVPFQPSGARPWLKPNLPFRETEAAAAAAEDA